MVDRERLLQRLLATFLGELDDHARAIERDLLALEKPSRPEDKSNLFKTLFRSAHSLKGAAAAVGISPIEAACHRLEEIFGSAQRGDLQLRPEVFQVLFEAADALRDARDRVKNKQDLESSPIATIIPRLTAASAGGPVAPPASASKNPESAVPAPLPAAPPEPRTSTTAPADTQRIAEDESIRVMSDKLDSLSAQSGELLVARGRIRQRIEQIAELQELVRHQRDGLKFAVTPHKYARAVGESVGSAGAPSFRARPVRGERIDFDSGGKTILDRIERDLQSLATQLNDDIKAIDRSSDSLDSDIRAMRMVPFAVACQGLERAARDLCAALGKKVALRIVGGDTQLDRSVLDRLRDPLLHLVRNAVDHGIEPPAARLAAGKPETGEIAVSAALRGGMVEIVVSDDGAGINTDAIRGILQNRGAEASDDDETLAKSIFLPGFSTAAQVTSLSGRGVGLDVVRANVEAMRGTVELSFRPNGGTTFTFLVPLTLGTIRALTVRVGDIVFAINSAAVDKLLRLRPSDLTSVEGRQVVMIDGVPVPLFSLADSLAMKVRAAIDHRDHAPAVLLSVAGRRAAFVVDELLDDRDVVIGTLGPRLISVPHVAGATMLEDGRVALILNTAELLGVSLGSERKLAIDVSDEETQRKSRRRLVVADDSVTTRTLEKNILESAGYDVRAAADGAEAWRLIQDGGADLVVSDVEMPQMDGLTLTQTIRRSTQFKNLPVILVTALENESDKARGMDAGANAYLLKSSFDQTELLETIEQILWEPD